MAKGSYKKGGYQKKEVKEFSEEVIQIDRVTRVVKGGRKMRFRATVAIGNKKGKVGIGIGKSNEVTGAIQKAISKAKKHMITVNLDGTTIPHDIDFKYKSSRIILMPASSGTGIIAGGPLRKVLELAGVKDILSKSLGTANKVNNTRCVFEALKILRKTPGMDRRAKERLAKQMVEQQKQKEKVKVRKEEPKPMQKQGQKPTQKPVQKPVQKPAIKQAAKPTPVPATAPTKEETTKETN